MFLKENIKLVDNISLLEDIINFNEEYYNIKNDIILEEYKILVEGETFDKLKEKAKNLYTIIVNFLKRMWEKLKQVYYTIKNKIFFTWDNVTKKIGKEEYGSIFEIYSLDLAISSGAIREAASGNFSKLNSIGATNSPKEDVLNDIKTLKNSISELILDQQNNIDTEMTKHKEFIENNKDNYESLDDRKVELSNFMLYSQKNITTIMKINSLLINKFSKYKIVKQEKGDIEGYYGDIPIDERQKRAHEAYVKGIKGEPMPNYNNKHEKYSYYSGKSQRKDYYANYDDPEGMIKINLETFN